MGEYNNLEAFRLELEILISRFSLENEGNIPDYMIADYLVSCFETLSKTVKAQNNWFGFKPFEGKIKSNE